MAKLGKDEYPYYTTYRVPLLLLLSVQQFSHHRSEKPTSTRTALALAAYYICSCYVATCAFRIPLPASVHTYGTDQDSYTQNAATFGTRVVPFPPRPSPATRSSSTLDEVDMLSLDAEADEGQDGRFWQNAVIRLARTSELNMNRAPTPFIKRCI